MCVCVSVAYLVCCVGVLPVKTRPDHDHCYDETAAWKLCSLVDGLFFFIRFFFGFSVSIFGSDSDGKGM